MAKFKRISGREAAEKLVSNAQNGASRWQQNTAEATGYAKEQAQKKKGKYKEGVERALQEDRYGAGVDNIDPAETAATINALGSGVFSSGLAARQGKIAKKFDRLMPLIHENADRVNGMPDDTQEQRKAKMLANFEGMLDVGKKMRQ